MATAVVGTRRISPGGDTTVTSKREVKFGSNEAWLGEDCAIIPDAPSLGQDLCQKLTLCKFTHLHKFVVCFPLRLILVSQISTELRGNKYKLFPRQNLLDVMKVASPSNFWMSVANIPWI